jgi:hypothetical protein
MGYINNFDYPDVEVDEAIGIIKIFKEKLGGQTNNFDSLAALLDHKSAKSGAFRAKLADLAKYGLVTGRGEVKLTQLAETIIYPKNNDELNDALKQMVFKVDLWKKLNQKLGGKNPDNNFWIILQEVTGADRGIAQNEADKIRKLYIDAMTKIKLESNMPISSQPEFQTSTMPSSSQTLELKAGELFLRLPKNESNIRLMISALENLLKEKTDKKESK